MFTLSFALEFYNFSKEYARSQLVSCFYLKKCNFRDTDIQYSTITICCCCTGRQICEMWLQEQSSKRKINFVRLHLKCNRKIYLTVAEIVGC